MKFMPFKSAASVLATLFLLQSAMAQVPAQTCNANIPIARPDTRYEAITGSNGEEVRDKVTKLVWQRCVLGKNWTGTTCAGAAATYTWQNALDAARTATASLVTGATAWRVPNRAELHSLAERACFNLAINTTWFPAAPAGAAWSSSPSTDQTDYAWVVSFNGNDADRGLKSNTNFVRLVRTGQ